MSLDENDIDPEYIKRYAEFQGECKKAKIYFGGIIKESTESNTVQLDHHDNMKECSKIIRNYIKDFEKISFLTEDNLDYDTGRSIIIEKSLSSESMVGKVFHGRLNSLNEVSTCHMAVKIIPISKRKDYAKSLDEVQIMNKVSKIVKDKQCEHLVMTYADFCCDEAKIPLKSLPMELNFHDAMYYGYVEKLTEFLFNEFNDIPMITGGSALIENVTKYEKEFMIIQNQITIKSTIDVKTYLAYNSILDNHKNTNTTPIFKRGKNFIKMLKNESEELNNTEILNNSYVHNVFDAHMYAHSRLSKKNKKMPKIDLTSQIRCRIILMELANHNLEQHIRKNLYKNTKDLADIILQVSIGLNALHRLLKHMHNDLRASNVLVFNQYDQETKKFHFKYKITDFGNTYDMTMPRPSYVEKRFPVEDMLQLLGSILAQMRKYIINYEIDESYIFIKNSILDFIDINNKTENATKPDALSRIMEKFMLKHKDLYMSDIEANIMNIFEFEKSMEIMPSSTISIQTKMNKKKSLKELIEAEHVEDRMDIFGKSFFK